MLFIFVLNKCNKTWLSRSKPYVLSTILSHNMDNMILFWTLFAPHPQGFMVQKFEDFSINPMLAAKQSDMWV